jgi:putative addiction module component (TIGR02574 family)
MHFNQSYAMTAILKEKADELITTLSVDERIALADLLYEGVPAESPDEIERGWSDEIKRRLDDLASGKAVTYSVEEVHDRMTQVLHEARQARARRHT